MMYIAVAVVIIVVAVVAIGVLSLAGNKSPQASGSVSNSIGAGASVPAAPSGKVSPAVLLADDLAKFNGVSNLFINYTATSYSSLGNSTSSEKIYMLNNESKILLTGSDGYVTAIYTFGKLVLYCTESSYGLGCFSVRYNQSLLNTTVLNASSILKVANKTGVSYGNVSTINGMSCDNFYMMENASLVDSYLNATLYQEYGLSLPNYSLDYRFCIDKQYGFPVINNVTQVSYSKLEGSNISAPASSMVALSYRTNAVSASNFQVPVTSTVDSFACAPNYAILNFTSYVNTPNTTVLIQNLNNYNFTNGTAAVVSNSSAGSTGTSSLAYGTSYYNITVPFNNNLGYSDVNVCIDKYCESEYCYVYSASGNVLV